MSEYTELTAKIEALEKRVKYLEDTFATLADMNKSSEMGQFIAQRQRVLIASKLVNAAAGTQKLNADAQQQVIDQLAAEKAAMDAKIEEAIRASAQNTPVEDALAEQFTYRDVPGGVEIQGFTGFDVGEELIIPQKIKEKDGRWHRRRSICKNDLQKGNPTGETSVYRKRCLFRLQAVIGC